MWRRVAGFGKSESLLFCISIGIFKTCFPECAKMVQSWDKSQLL